MEDRGKCRKRPDLQYYKPPKMVNKSNNREEEMPVNDKMEERSFHESSSYSDSGCGGGRSSVDTKNRSNHHNKKPDKPVYIPRSKSNTIPSGGSSNDQNNQRKRPENSGKYSKDNIDGDDGNRNRYERADAGGHHHHLHHGNHQSVRKNQDSSPSIHQPDTISPLVFENSRYHRNRSEHDKDQRNRHHGESHQNNTFARGGRTMLPHDSKKKTPEELNERNYPHGQSDPNMSAASTSVESNQGSKTKPVSSVPPPESNPSSNKALNCPDRPSHSHSSSHHSIKPGSPSSPVVHHQSPHPPASYPCQATHQQHQQPYQNHQAYNHQPPTPNRQYLHRPQDNENKSQSHGEGTSHRSQWQNNDPSSPGGSQSGFGNNQRSRNKKFNRVDHKTFEQNLPPRLQRKLMMEKANMNRASQQHLSPNEHGNQPNPNPPHQEYGSTNMPTASNRGGIIRLPQDSSMNIPQYYNPSPSGRHGNQRNDSQYEYGPNMDMVYGNFHGDPKNWNNTNQPSSPGNIFARQLYDPYSTSKPTVMIRPTAHTPYQSNDHPRCLILPGMIPVPVTSAATDHSITQVASNAMVNSTNNDLPEMKTWPQPGPVNQQQQPENNRLLPTSPPNVLVHYIPNYSSPPHINHHRQTDEVQSNQVSANHQPFDSTPAYSRRKLVEKNMTEIINLENELQSCLLKYPSHDERAVNTLRWKIQRRYESLIIADPKFCAEHNVELSLWKSVFYQFIEMRRRELEENPKAETSKDELLKLVEESTMFFENLLVMLQDAFDFSVDKYIDHQYDLEKPGYEMVKLAAISAQKLYLYLGDLARYKEQAAGGSNYSKAKSYYTKAQQIAPKNGRPYNQLALLAMYGRRRLDAVYNYMRSLAASNPFQSARESLLSIFEEVRKKYEAAESKRMSEKLGALKFSDSTSPQDKDFLVNNIYGERLEIWIRPDGTSSKHTSVMGNESEEEELDLLTDIDLNKRFVLSFLHVHGKLFTKIGLETFNSAVNLMLLEFRCLLKRSPFPMSSQRLLQLMAISMFSVYQVSIKEGIYKPTHRSSLQEQAIQVILAMVSLLLEKADRSLKDHLTKGNSTNIVSDDVAEILPAIKVWTDWMSCQKQFWSPPLSKPGFRIGAGGDIWSLFAEFLTRLGDINTRAIKLLPTKFEGCEQVILPEDNLLSGFIPLLGAPSALSYVQTPFDKEKARTCLRVSRIQFFGDYLCGIPEPYLEFDVGKKRFHSSVKTSYTDENSEGGHNINLDLDDDLEDIPTDSSSGENLNIEDYEKKLDDPVLDELWSRQESLRQAQRREEKIRKQLDAMLREEKRRRLVIQPRFLLPDTNCFIHHLNKLQTLINCGHFEIIVPLIVINELNGLMSRVQQSSSNSPLPPSFICEGSGADDHEHEKRVGQSAEEAFQYLERAFDEKNNKLKAITSKGSILNSMSFRNESLKTKGTNNDDLVLSCCLQFIKRRSSAKQSNPEDSDGVVNIFRETVLLTDDRNLRVKALSHNVPVKSLPVFLQFANLQ